MDKFDIIIKNKNKILNFGTAFLFLFIAFQIYSFGNKQAASLIEGKENELKKNKVIENLTSLEKKIEGYKKSLVKQDLWSVMNSVSNIAKAYSVQIISIKPVKEEAYADYIISSFMITARGTDYHSLADFISKIENSKDIYLVEEVDIAASGPSRAENSADTNLNVTLKISNISYL